MEAAAISATFSDFRIVKGRKVAQLVLEVPLEKANSALAALGGIPQPATETWVAVARLTAEPKSEKPKERRRFEELPLSQQAALRCNDPEFQGWLDVANADRAAAEVRLRCAVKSRAELDSNNFAADLWRDLDSCFLSETGRVTEQR